MKIKDLGNGNYQTWPETDDMIEVDDIDAWVEANRPASEKAADRIDELKRLLSDTDYLAIKFAEGELSEEEFAETRTKRREWRAEINELQSRYNIE